jgi:hypothetical protein
VKFHLEAVTSGCLAAARVLGAWKGLEEFYLAGGTALALIYGHRVSVDLDFFSSTNVLGFTERQPLLETLREAGGRIEEEKDGTVHARLEGAHISFFRYRYPLLAPLSPWERIRLAHPRDIGLMKLGAIIGRGSRKDFVDLHTILQEEISLRSLLRLADKKFPGSHDFKVHALRALVYFDDADTEPELRMRQDMRWPAIKRFFETEVRALARPFS